MQVVFAEKHGSGFFEATSNLSISKWDTILHQRAGCGSAYPGGIDQIFQADRNSVQRSTPVSLPDLTFGLTRLRQRRFRSDGYERVQSRIEFFNAGQAVRRKLDWRERACADLL